MEKELYVNFSATDKFEEINYELKLAIRCAVEATLVREGFLYPAEVSVTLGSAEYIHELNKMYRGGDRPTDVLSFPLYEDGEFDEAECQLGAPLGDIVISIPRAKEQARELGNSFVREVAFLTIHSTLHLLGYDHERSEEEDKEMRAKQTEIMKIMGLEVK